MRTTTRPNTAQQAQGPAGARARRPWPVTANSLLLLLEAFGFALMAIAYLAPLGVRWPFTNALWDEHRAEMVLGFVLALLGVLALAAAAGFLRVANGAWLLAVFVQGLNLGVALVLYFESRPTFVYGMMVYGIVMVLYLHQADVQAAFRPDEPRREEGASA